MKLAYAIGTPDTNSKMLAYCGKTEDVLASLKEIGYAGLELFVRDPKSMDVQLFSHLVERYGFEVPAIGTGPVVSEDKLTFASNDESVRVAAIERTKSIIDFAALFQSQVNIGKLRGDIQKSNENQSREWMKYAFETVCEYAGTKGIDITFEPQNRFVINNLNTTQQAIAWIRELNIPNLYMMMDLFHMNIEDKSIVTSIIEAKNYNIHLHFTDNNRGVPGTGHIDFVEIIRVLKALNYNRYISIEIDQIPDSYHAAKESFEYLNNIIKGE